LKRSVKKKTARPYAVAKLKDPQTSRRHELELSNRFAVLQEDLSIEDKWELFSTSVKASADTVIGRRRSTNRERWTGLALANRRHCSNFPSFPFSCFLSLFSLSVPLLSLPFPPYQLAVWRKGRHAKSFGWAKSFPPHHLPFSYLYLFPFSSPLA